MKYLIGQKRVVVGGKKQLREYDALDEVKAKLKKMKVELRPRPRNKDGEVLDPIIPSDLTRLNDHNLGKLYSEFCAMAQWVHMRKAVHAVERVIAQGAERYIRASMRLKKSGSGWDKNAKIEVDPLVRERAIKSLAAEGIEIMTEAMMQGYLLGKEACSRELTRRQSTMGNNTLQR